MPAKVSDRYLALVSEALKLAGRPLCASELAHALAHVASESTVRNALHQLVRDKKVRTHEFRRTDEVRFNGGIVREKEVRVTLYEPV